MLADLHLHSTCSDGTLRPEQLVAAAHANGVRCMALSDHDTLAGHRVAAAACQRYGIELIRAVELNTDVPDAEVHVLGYFVDGQLPWFRRFLARRRAARRRRGRDMVERLVELGLPLRYEQVQAFAQGGVVARPHLARAMIEAGLVHDEAEAFDRYLGVGCPAYVIRDRLSPEAAIRAIRRAGGVAVLAHPAWFPIDDRLPALVAAGLGGIECYYSEHSPDQTRHYLDLASRLDLVPTVGSDCHGPGSKKPYPPGSVAAPPDLVERLRARRPAPLVA